MAGIRSVPLTIKGKELRVSIAHDSANARDLLNEIRKAKEKGLEPSYHFVVVMAYGKIGFKVSRNEKNTRLPEGKKQWGREPGRKIGGGETIPGD
ncbi:hypothetical protein [Desulfobotulus sp.]|jgi:hypothetical protein|uniref:hypothetical protein n=1 Tax=Desulfobotulus sp. TaxID=1940337 RepID=UPI002A361480|nr:hypothetical protein [Desulfobotulus sp.]MDY0161626.1 hypothetical protein [Desulfobotulus sp.]